MTRKNKFTPASAIVLGMHDALVSLTGLIAGLTFAMSDRYTIILTGILASITAGLSMGASNYLAMRTNANSHAIFAAMYTGGAYMITCVILIIPFVFLQNTIHALTVMFILAIIIIFGFNYWCGRIFHRPYIKSFVEMLVICTTISVVAFIIGWGAQKCFGIEI